MTLSSGESVNFRLKEGGVRLQLSVVDTPGFGDNIDNTDWVVELVTSEDE